MCVYLELITGTGNGSIFSMLCIEHKKVHGIDICEY